jgi:UDP-N-acetylglucosamine acyltransferase
VRPFVPAATQHERERMINTIHPTAVVSPQARLGMGNVIGPYAVIEDDVVIGSNNRIAAHCVIKTRSRIGDGNALHEHVVFGGPPQDKGFVEKETWAVLGNGNTLREFVTINRGSKEGETRLGNGNYLMVSAHVGHDCQLGDDIVIAPSSGLGGHVRVATRAFISGGVMVHQFVRIGSLAMIGGNSKITQDVLPFMIADGAPAVVRGLNKVGLRRAGLNSAELQALKRAFRVLFDTHRPPAEIAADLRALATPHTQQLADFITASKRGFHRTARGAGTPTGADD